jgi:hypothetical protein
VLQLLKDNEDLFFAPPFCSPEKVFSSGGTCPLQLSVSNRWSMRVAIMNLITTMPLHPMAQLEECSIVVWFA